MSSSDLLVCELGDEASLSDAAITAKQHFEEVIVVAIHA